MKELVEVIAKALVDDPEGVSVLERQEGKTIRTNPSESLIRAREVLR